MKRQLVHFFASLVLAVILLSLEGFLATVWYPDPNGWGGWIVGVYVVSSFFRWPLTGVWVALSFFFFKWPDFDSRGIGFKIIAGFASIFIALATGLSEWYLIGYVITGALLGLHLILASKLVSLLLNRRWGEPSR